VTERKLVPVEGKTDQTDHDLLIRLDQNVLNLTTSIAEKFGTLSQTITRRDRVVDDRYTDQENRVRAVEAVIERVTNTPERITSLERKVWSIPGAATVIALGALSVGIWNAFHS